MPVKLPNGVEVFNATPHELVFFHDFWVKPVVVESEAVINAQSRNEEVGRGRGYVLVNMKFVEREEGRDLIERVKELYPNCLIIGSMIAAQAYAGDVVCTLPYHSDRMAKSERYVKANRFTVFQRRER